MALNKKEWKPTAVRDENLSKSNWERIELVSPMKNNLPNFKIEKENEI